MRTDTHYMHTVYFHLSYSIQFYNIYRLDKIINRKENINKRFKFAFVSIEVLISNYFSESLSSEHSRAIIPPLCTVTILLGLARLNAFTPRKRANNQKASLALDAAEKTQKTHISSLS